MELIILRNHSLSNIVFSFLIDCQHFLLHFLEQIFRFFLYFSIVSYILGLKVNIIIMFLCSIDLIFSQSLSIRYECFAFSWFFSFSCLSLGNIYRILSFENRLFLFLWLFNLLILLIFWTIDIKVILFILLTVRLGMLKQGWIIIDHINFNWSELRFNQSYWFFGH